MSLSGRNLVVRAGRRTLLHGVSLTVAPGELVAILGPNGAGKSTLLRTLTGDLVPHTGAVEMDGRALEHWTLEDCAKRRAVLPQHTAIAFPFTALEVVLLGRTAWRERRPRSTAIARDAMVAAGAADFEDREYPTLSGGERQRVQFARVLAQVWEPPLPEAGRYLLLDEPTTGLDLVHQQAVLTLARERAREGFGVLAILHDPNLAFAYADRIVVLSAGRILAEGAAHTLADAALFETAFGLKVDMITHPTTGRPWVLPRVSP